MECSQYLVHSRSKGCRLTTPICKDHLHAFRQFHDGIWLVDLIIVYSYMRQEQTKIFVRRFFLPQSLTDTVRHQHSIIFFRQIYRWFSRMTRILKLNLRFKGARSCQCYKCTRIRISIRISQISTSNPRRNTPPSQNHIFSMVELRQVIAFLNRGRGGGKVRFLNNIYFIACLQWIVCRFVCRSIYKLACSLCRLCNIHGNWIAKLLILIGAIQHLKCDDRTRSHILPFKVLRCYADSRILSVISGNSVNTALVGICCPRCRCS